MKPSLNISGGIATISGDLTHQYRNDILVLLKKVTNEELRCIVSNPSSIDLSYLQLLWSAYIYHKSVGKSLSIELQLNDQDNQLLHNTGFKMFLTITN